MNTLFISDLHLSSERPEIISLFLGFLNKRAARSEALYILGDLFEAWIGDDYTEPSVKPIITAFKSLTDNGLPIYIMHGNRDFLMADGFEQQTGCTLISDPTHISLYGTDTLLMHGDTLCTDDKDYQILRKQFHDKVWQQDVLSKPIEARLAFAQHALAESKKETGKKSNTIMDVNQQAVEQKFQQYDVPQLIHGHTHRQNFHNFLLDGKQRVRIVLGDWYRTGNVLNCDEHGCQFETVT